MALSKWSPQEIEQLKNLWGTATPEEIAQQLNRSVNGINHEASRLGISNRKARWTEEELEYLEENWGRYKLETLCKHLKRPKDGVIDMAVRVLALGPSTQNQGKLTARCLATAIGVCPETVFKWLNRHGLKHAKKVTRRSKKVYQIDLKDFWKWAETNQHRFDSMRFEKGILGPEPPWMKEKRREDFWRNKERVV